MGSDVEETSFTKRDYTRFAKIVRQQLHELKDVMHGPKFGQDALLIGAELEMYLVDSQLKVACQNETLLKLLNDEAFQVEINQYNLELNLPPIEFSQRPFSQMQDSLNAYLLRLSESCKELDLHAVPIGILPTLRYIDLDPNNMTQRPRYRLLGQQLQSLRGEPFSVDISAEESVSFHCDDVTAEGANTSFQVHIMVPNDEFVSIFNALQLTQSLVTAIAANSPILLGKSLWHETRIALFEQSLDCKIKQGRGWLEPPRVTFGSGWLRNSAWELFADAVSVYSPLLPIIRNPGAEEGSLEQNRSSADGALPSFQELSLHMGTIWPWNRPVYCSEGSGHVRIELRALPAGPSVVDMVSNTAFALGLAFGLRNKIDDLIAEVPFHVAQSNFLRAAQWGLDANIMWPLSKGDCQTPTSILSVLNNMIPVAKSGLLDMGIDEAEIAQYIGVIEKRVQEKMNGAIWQINTLKHLRGNSSAQQTEYDDACRNLVELYLKCANSGEAITEWQRLWQ